ncbi:alpha-L-rhamnosidase C-terminal domain-containing protein [Kutzneria sp. NPDC051319]|uniref:alpha-L-rhamnosidase C-terminal domain-containing protein n=1 Tax=Kutzneria sp. NPDC051319 TaxID=3155047 RepID=UPI00341B0D44
MHVAASIDTVRGAVTSNGTSTAHSFTLDVRNPANATATISVPLLGHHAPRRRRRDAAVDQRRCRQLCGGFGDLHFTEQ